MMKLNNAPCGVTQTVPIFKGNVTSNDGEDCVKGGILKGTKYAWLCQGPFLKIIDVSSGEKIAGWRFGAACLDFVSDVSCAVELPHNDDACNLKQIVLGLECEVSGGMICIFDVQGSRLLRAIRIPGKPLSLSIVDSGSSGCEGRYPLPGLLSSMCGIIAVGLQGGSVFLVDLCRLSCDELLNTWFNDDRDKVHDEFSPCQLLPINKDDDDSDKLEKKCATAAVSGDHLCLLLNEGAFVQDNFLLLEPDGNVCACHKSRNIGVTSLLYVPRIASLIVGFSFGCFQLWNLMHLTLNYTSRMMKDPLPVMHLGFQEPSDDPCNFCYIWAVHSTTDEFPSSSPPVGIMYALSYESKEWVDGYGYLYQDYQSCHFRLEYNLEVGSSEDVDSICCVAFNTLSNVAIQRSMPEDGYDEAATENDFSLCIFAWEAYDSENKPISTYLSLFDLNQWYKDQMPARVIDVEDDNLGYLVTFNLNCIRQKGEEASSLVDTPLLDVRVDPQNLSQFKSFQPQEEHFHPSALSFVSYCLLEDRIASISHPGLQRYLLLYMEKEGPICLLRPVNLFKHCVMVGLKPILMDMNSPNDIPAVTQREFLLSIALENQMLGFLHRCASDWANGSVSGVDCSLPMLLSWGYQRAAMLKETAVELCVHLFDHTGVRLDKNECRLLDNCATQLRQLATLFDGILNDCRLLGLLDLEDFRQKASELNLAALYFEVLQWFLNVGLLPEFPEDDFDVEPSDVCNTSVDKIPYPATTLTRFYTDRRQEFKSLNLKNGTKACLYIDQLLQNENNGSELTVLWQSDGGSGMYPPPSVQSLLAMYLLDGIDIQTKNSIVIYVFLDLATLLDPDRYSRTIEYFVKFPCAFCMTPSIIKVTQAFWLLDQKHFEDALDMVLDPLVSPKDLQPWQHRFIVHALLSQGQHVKALEYFTIRQLPIQGIEDIQLKISLLVMNKQVTQAYNFLHQYHNEENCKELLYHFYQECGKVQQLGTVLKLMLSPAEEELLMNFLQNCNISQSEDMQVVFYLMRSRVIEAVAVNERINFSGTRKPSFRRSRNDPTVRDVLVGGYGKTLPSVTRQLANYCSQQKKLISSWRQVQRPTPMSVDVNYGTKQPVSYKSSLIHATLEKARETWMMPLHSSFSSEVKNKELMDVSAMQNLPFLCTSHDSFRHDRETTPVVFPAVASATKRRLDDDGGSHTSTPLKRSRLENSPSVESFLLISNKKNVLDQSVNNSPLLLKSPLVKRITPLKQLNDRSTREKNGSRPFAETFTPQSILKVRNLVRRSNSPEESDARADDLLHPEQSRTRQSEERLCARQIRFNLPGTNDLEENEPLSDSTPIHSFNRGKSPNRIVDASARLPLRSSLTLLSKPVVEVNREVSSNLSDKRSWFTSPSVKEICKNVSELNSEKSIEEQATNIHIEDEKSKVNDTFGEESFYSATSSSDSGSSKISCNIDSAGDEECPSNNREKYIHNIKKIQPRRQLSRLKPGLQNKSVIHEESVLSVTVTEEKKYSSSTVSHFEKHQTLGGIDIKNLYKNNVNQQTHKVEHTDKMSDEDSHDNSDDSEEDSVVNCSTFKKSILGDTFVETIPSHLEPKEDSDASVENDVEDLNSELSYRKDDEKESDDSFANNDDDSENDNVTSSCTFQKSILDHTFIEETTQKHDESKEENDIMLEDDVQDLNSEVSDENGAGKESDDNDRNKSDISIDDSVISSSTFKKSILGDTCIENSRLFLDTSQNKDKSNKGKDASLNIDVQDLKSEPSHENKESSFVRIQQIKARRPLSRISKSGPFISNLDSSLYQMDKSSSSYWGNYEKDSIKDDKGVDIEDNFHQEAKENEDTQLKDYNIQDDVGSSNAQGISNEYEKNREDTIEVVKVVEVNNGNLSSNIKSKVKESRSLFSTNVESHVICTENLFQSKENIFVNIDSQNLVQNIEFQNSQKLSFKESENDEECIMAGEKTYATLSAVSSEQSDYVYLLPSQNEVCKEIGGNIGTELKNQGIVLSSNLIAEKVYPPVVTSTSITSFLESSPPYGSSEEICDDNKIIIDSPIQSYEVHHKSSDTNESPVEQSSSSTAGDTSGTIELDSDESDEKNAAETFLQKDQIIAMKDEVESRLKGCEKEVKQKSLQITSYKEDFTVESNEVIVIDSDTSCNKITMNEQNREYVEHDSTLFKESFGGKQQGTQEISERGRMNPEQGSSLNESGPLVLKLSDSENDAECPHKIEETKYYIEIVGESRDTEISPSSINVNIENQKAIASSIYPSNKMENICEEKCESQEKHEDKVETCHKNVVDSENMEVDQSGELKEQKHAEAFTETLSPGSSVCNETEVIANPVYQQNTLNVEIENKQQSTSNMELSSHSGIASPQSTTANVIVSEDQEFEQSKSETGDAHYSLRSFQNYHSSAALEEVSQNSNVSGNEYPTKDQNEVKKKCYGQVARTRDQRNTVQTETESRSEAEITSENKDGIVTVEEISIPRTRQRNRPSSVQSEPPQLSDVLEAGNNSINKNVGTPQGHGGDMSRLRRRRSSLQIEVELGSDRENVPENKGRTEQVKEISTPRTRQRGQPSSIQSEPPQMSDLLGAENLLVDEEGGTPQARSGEMKRLRRRRSSLQIEPVQTSDDKKSEEVEEVISGEISTPKSRLRIQRTSIQSEPADTTGIVAKEIGGSGERTEISFERSSQLIKTRRRSSLNVEPMTTGGDESFSDNKNRIERVGEIGTPKSRQRDRPSSVQNEPSQMTDEVTETQTPENSENIFGSRSRREKEMTTPRTRQRSRASSVQSEPPQISDVMTENQSPDQNLRIAKGQSKEGIRLRRRRSSLQFEPFQMGDEIASETNKETKDESAVKELKINESENFNEGGKKQSSLQSDNKEGDTVTDTKERIEVEESSIQRNKHGIRSSIIHQEPFKEVDISKESKTSVDASESTNISDNISESLLFHKKKPQLTKLFDPHKNRFGMNLRSARSFSEEREISVVKDKKFGSPETDSDDFSIQSEPPQLRDVSEVRQLRNLRSRKGSLKKKKSKKSMYKLKISPPKLACVKEEPESDANTGDGGNIQSCKDTGYEESPIIVSTRSLRNRKRTDSVSSQASSIGEGRVLRSMHSEADSPSSISSKSTLILDHSNKRKRCSSPSSPEEQEVKKYLKDTGNKSTLKNNAGESKEKSVKTSNSDDTIEQYATARRLTRYQKNVMERSIDTTKGVRHEFQQSHYHSEKTADDSDGESEASGYTSGSSHIRASARLQEKRLIMNDRSPSQSSSVSIGGDRTPKKQIIRHHSPVRTSPEEHSEKSPASVRSGISTSNASSLSSSQWQWRSPNSECSKGSSRPRRRSFQKAQMALHSPAKKETSSKTSDVATTDTSEGDIEDKVPGRRPLKKEYETASEAGSERSQSSAVSSTLSRSTRSSAKNTAFSSPAKSQERTKLSDDWPPRSLRQHQQTSESHSSTEDSPQKDSKLKKKPSTSKDIDQIAVRESQKPERKSQIPERESYPGVRRRRKYLKLHSKRKVT